MRGRLQHHLHKNDEAVKDLTTGFKLLPTAEAALTLGEIAEEDKHSDEAIRQYATAFVLSSEQQPDSQSPPLDRERLRLRMGNLWRFTHDSNAGLGDILLTAYDRNREVIKEQKSDAPVYNKDVTDPLQFSLRHVDGSGPMKLAESHGKVVVVNFWTTWCAYCTQMETMLGDLRTKFSGRGDVVFVAINADEDESAVYRVAAGPEAGRDAGIRRRRERRVSRGVDSDDPGAGQGRKNCVSHAGICAGWICRSGGRSDHQGRCCPLARYAESVGQASACLVLICAGC